MENNEIEGELHHKYEIDEEKEELQKTAEKPVE